MTTTNYQSWEKPDLINEIHRLRKHKKYGLVWEDKPENVVEQCKTELPVLEEVKDKEIITDPDKPVNLLIEGDNYHALSVLNYTHKGKIDVIYIDPPYNTGNKDFVYNDRYVDKEDSYRHSKWLSFMSNRLKLAKRLLKNTGVIFISIDDNEMAQLKFLCDEVFGENNFIASAVRKRRASQANLSKNLSIIHEYVVIYGKGIGVELNKISTSIDDTKYKNINNDPRGPYVTMPCSNKGGSKYEIETPTGKIHIDEWRFKKETFVTLLQENKIVFPKKGDGKPRYKLFLEEKKNKGMIINSWWDFLATNQKASAELKEIFNSEVVFNNPKPKELLKFICTLNGDTDSIILDFMAGSGTTGHAVLELNKQDGGNRKFILCTNNELNGKEKELREKGLSEKEIQSHGICQAVTYPRIKKVIEGYSNVKGLPANLKYYKTNFVPADPTDKNKIALTKKATAMLCVKEDTFEEVKSTEQYKIFRNKERYTGIVFDYQAIDDFKKEIAKIDGKFSLYIFSLGDDTFDEEFEDIKKKVKLSPIPETILKVYREIFKLNSK